MSGNIRVTPAELEQVASRYLQESSMANEQVTRLDNMIDQLVSMWEGQASQAFADQYAELRPSYVRMSQLLEEVSRQLQSASNALQEADSNVANQIRG
ncbi:WXG100 family type VII secretion target [Jeotgalibacillus sp. S-D1]|uniref:WXG100 family type VII secretion target n=1 Tax=Jeotgalibacillus sp. S-D1 TaxID=2552189 RepID=UPI00105A57E3|nr:WXG100 family type VII secretion target [Jeotgalibacillus sp. S-D1]TDL31369.1 WXG100 family type VII secretion target [Jeotgalibacillus sp. S-D1]